MYEAFEPVTAGVSTTLSTFSDINFTGAVDGFRNPAAVLQNDGTRYYYHMYMGTDYEWGWGVWDGATLSRNVVNSSNSDAKVNWGAGDKTVAIGASPSMLTEFMPLVLGKPVDEAWFLFCMGQSNCGILIFGSQDMVDNPNVQDFSTDGSTYDTADLEWREVTHSDQYEYNTAGTGVTVGTARQAFLFGIWTTPFSLPYQIANLYNIFTNKKVGIFNVWRNGTALQDAQGWLYDPGSENVSDIAATFMPDAIANPPAGWTFPATPDKCFMIQGNADMNADVNSFIYGDLLGGIFRDFSDEPRYNMMKQDQQWFKSEPVEGGRNLKPDWNGDNMAAELWPNINVVSSDGLATLDGAHFTEEAGKAYAMRFVQASLLSGNPVRSGLGVAAKRKYIESVQAPIFANVFTLGADSDTIPVGNGKMQFNVARTKLWVSKIDGALVPADYYAAGFRFLSREGTVIRLVDNTAPTTNYYSVGISYLPSLVGATDEIMEWDVVSVLTVGAPPAGLAIMAPFGLTSGELDSFETLIDQVRLPSLSEGAPYLTEVLNPWQASGPINSSTGQLVKSKANGVVSVATNVADDFANKNIIYGLPPINTAYSSEFTVQGISADNLEAYSAVVRVVHRKAGNISNQNFIVGEDIDEIMPVTGITLEVRGNAGSGTMSLRVSTSGLGQAWRFVCVARCVPLPDAL